MANYKVDQRKKVVIAYNQSMDGDDDKQVEKYKKLGYEVKLLERKAPVKKSQPKKEEMIKYLKGFIDDDLYNEFKDKVDKKYNFLKLKWWLIEKLKDRAKEQNKKYEPVEDIINKAKTIEEEKKKQEEAKKQEEENKNKNKDKSNENK